VLLVGGLEPVLALLHVGVARLRGIGDEERVLFGEPVHVGARGEVVGVLGATVEHDDQGHILPGVAAGNVELVRTGPRAVGVRPVDETASLGLWYTPLRWPLDASGQRVRLRDGPRGRVGPTAGRASGFRRASLGLSDNPGGDVYRSVVQTSQLLRRYERATEGAAEGTLDRGGRLVEVSLPRESRGFGDAAVMPLCIWSFIDSFLYGLWIRSSSADFTAGLA
jgi:hypothetical protein